MPEVAERRYLWHGRLRESLTVSVRPETATPPHPEPAPPADGSGHGLAPAPEIEADGARRDSEPELRPPRGRARSRPAWLWPALAAAVIVGIGLLLRWRAARPIEVTVVSPRPRAVMETVAASGQVGGKREVVVGAPIQGVVAELWVEEGSVVPRGQPLARIRNEVAEAQVRQAEQALQTARAQLAEAAAGARPTELAAARAQVSQAEATVRERAAAVRQAEAAVTQAQARQDLAEKSVQRARSLFAQDAIARQDVDQAESEYRTATAALAAARDAVATARASRAAAEAALAASKAQLDTLWAGPRSEAIRVARQRVREAEAALLVARRQAQNAIVSAPFAGTVTQILSERGAFVGPATGVVRLVQTVVPEIRVDVDESNLAELKVGQRAIITSSTFRNVRLGARVTRIGAQVDPTRGTVTVTLVPDSQPAWLRPGQTVNVNIIIHPSITRLVIPRSAVKREGGAETVSGRSLVYVVQNGRAEPRSVILGPVEGDQIPVLEGLSARDQVIQDAERVQAGARVRARRRV
jgi:HlyD family secretion protein